MFVPQMRVLIVLFVLRLLVTLVSCSSSGLFSQAICNVEGPFGCNPEDYFPPDNRANCTSKAGRHMHWAKKAVKTNNITLGAEIQGSEVFEYVPSKLLEVKIQVHHPNQFYVGILMYAVDLRGNKVGRWNLPDEAEPHFQITRFCGNQTIVHTNPSTKYTTHRLSFISPKIGTGQITFKALMKSGPANYGDFWWPPELVLNEGPEITSPNSQMIWMKGKINQSCDEACGDNSLRCDNKGMETLNSAENLDVHLWPHQLTCPHPALLSCNSTGPSVDVIDSLCYYSSPQQCALVGKPFYQISCDSKNENLSRLCACTTTSTPESIIADVAPSTHPPRVILLLVISFVLFLQNRTKIPLLLLFISVAYCVKAHNFLALPSRSTYQASSFRGCPQKSNSFPHVQVGVGQNFQVEWDVGHTGVTYWAIVRAKDESQLKKLNRIILEDYLRNAPAIPGITVNGGNITNALYQRYHRHGENSLLNRPASPGGISSFKRIVNSGDPNYIPRPPNFLAHSGSLTNPYQLEYPGAAIRDDRRAEYFSAKYPFILSAAKFVHNVDRFATTDVALLRVPANSSPGNYIAWWGWEGYYDCVDVQALQLTNPIPLQRTYGDTTNKIEWFKVDHAAPVLEIIDRLGIVSPSSGCTLMSPSQPQIGLDTCKRMCNESVCFGVAVVPLSVPEGSVFDKSLLPIPWNKRDSLGRNMCNQTRLSSAPNSDRLCFPVIPTKNFFFTVQPFVSQIRDAQHPAFGASFFFKNVIPTFPIATSYDLSFRKLEWRFGEHCVKCSDMIISSNYSVISPLFQPTKICQNCDRE